MKGRTAPYLGDFETEVVLPCRVEYRVDGEGELEITAILPIGDALPPGTRLALDSLPEREQRCLTAEAVAAVEEARAEANLAGALERRESRR